ncbi:hypothetical protein DQT32_05310 [Salmonella enterica subsp. enterica serovar Braenderup]|nr:hypothetical protein [Salmonella enterica subsp. enterica serovar Braenderup]
MTVEDIEALINDARQEGYDDGLEYGTELGQQEGYDNAKSELIDWYEDRVSDLKDEHENDLEKEYKKGMDDKEAEMQPTIDSLRYHMEMNIESLQAQILELKKQNLKLRIENATITRSVQKST